MQREEGRYGGRVPSKWRKASVASLYWMRYFNGSQWSAFKSGVTWLRFDFFRDEPCGIVLGLLHARDLFIGYSCERSTAVVQSWRDHRHNELFCGTVRQERTGRRDSPERQKRCVAEAIDVLFHWQCLVKMHSKVRNDGLKRNPTSTYIWRLAADRTDTHWWIYKHHLRVVVFFFSFFLC